MKVYYGHCWDTDDFNVLPWWKSMNWLFLGLMFCTQSYLYKLFIAKKASKLRGGKSVLLSAQHPAVMHTSRPSHVYVCEPVAMIYAKKYFSICLKRWNTFPFFDLIAHCQQSCALCFTNNSCMLWPGPEPLPVESTCVVRWWCHYWDTTSIYSVQTAKILVKWNK